MKTDKEADNHIKCYMVDASITTAEILLFISGLSMFFILLLNLLLIYLIINIENIPKLLFLKNAVNLLAFARQIIQCRVHVTANLRR